MKLVDLFEALVPKAQRRVVGIRPGEKIHEALLTETEVRHSLELQDYYLVLPEQSEIFNIKSRFSKYFEMGAPLAGGFVYTSNSNSRWLTPGDLQALIRNLEL